MRGQSHNLSKQVLQNEYAKEIVPAFGAKGMTWMRVTEGRLESNIVQFFTEEEQRRVLERFEARDGDVILMIADPSWHLVVSALGQLRLHVANRLGLIPADAYRPLWVTEFPLFEATEDGITSSHHPFTMPDRTDFDPANREELLALRSRSYDLVMNGEELGGGSIRINDRELQNRIFLALGLSMEEVEEKFGFFLRALSFGAPPHGGIALGLDRVVSMVLGAPSIREVIAFPKNRSAFCPLAQAPSPVARKQLAELGFLDGGEGEILPGHGQQEDLVSSLSWFSRIAIHESEREAVSGAVQEAVRLAELVAEWAPEGEPLFTVSPPPSRVRPGLEAKVCPLAGTRELFRNAPAMKGGLFKVASILE